VHTLWLWLAVEMLTKIIPVLHLGMGTQAAAHATVHALHQRLAPGCIPVFTSDGLNLYFYALTAQFGQWVADVGRRAQSWQLAAGLIYGQVKKTYRRRKLVRVTQVMRCGTSVELSTALKQLGLSGRLNTACIERLNLTVRQMVAALVRRTWSTTQAAPQLLTHLHGWQAYYHFVRPHKSLRVALAQPIERGGKRVPQHEKATESGNGCRTDTQALECPRGADASARATTDRSRQKQGKQGERAAGAPDWDRSRLIGVRRGEQGYRIRVTANPKSSQKTRTELSTKDNGSTNICMAIPAMKLPTSSRRRITTWPMAWT